MAALYDLVFGIRQGVEDLNYRLQETDAKVDLFLRTLTSLQDSLASSPTEAVPMEESDATMDAVTGTTMGAAPGAASRATADANQESTAEATVSDVGHERIWAYQPTYVEEEPWPGDLRGKWPNFASGV